MTFFRDFRIALRRWKHRPAFAATAITTLAVGISATTAIFSVVDAVLLKPLPWRDSDRLVSVYVARPHWRSSPVLSGSWNTGNLSWPMFEDLRTRSRALSEVAVWNRVRPTLNGERNEMLYGLQVSSSFFPLLGVTPHVGRFFTPDEDVAATTSVIVSYEAWQRRYGGSPGVLGQRIMLNETPYAIVGVLPPGFDFRGINPAEFVMPWGNTPAGDRHAGNHFMYGIARLADGVQLPDAVADADPLMRGTEKPEEKQARLAPLAEDQLGRNRLPLWILFGAAGLLLLIACANVAGLVLAESRSRKHEVAVRIAVGGTRRAVVQQFLIESVALALVAIALALVLVVWLTPLLGSLTPAQVPRAGAIAVNARVFGFGVLIGLATALLFGVAPALTFARINPAQWIQRGGRGSSRARYRTDHSIVAAEVALAVVLVTAASLFGETLVRLTAEPIGFNPKNLVMASLRLPRDPAIDAAARVRMNEVLVAALSALPGVESTSVTSTTPFSGSYGSNSLTIAGKPDLKAESGRHVIDEGYFRTLGIPVIKGRGFDSTDQPGRFAALVSLEFERRYLDGDAIGKQFTLNGNTHDVVGVVPVTKHRRYNDEPIPAMYILARQLPNWAVPQIVIRTAAAAGPMLPTIRKTIETQNPQAAIETLETMNDLMRRTVADEVYRARLSLVFGATALLLAAIGLYGLVARTVADERREIGVRVALGAPRRAVVSFVLRQAVMPVAAGLVLGVAVSLAASGYMSTMLYGTTATSPHTFVIVVALLSGAALIASLVPAHRASRIDPIVALRSE